MTKQYARDSDIIGTTSQYQKFLKECKKIYMTRTKYLQTSVPVLHSEVIKSFTFQKDFQKGHQASTNELEVIMKRFPVINSSVVNDRKSEFLDYQAAPDKELSAYYDEDDKPMIGTKFPSRRTRLIEAKTAWPLRRKTRIKAREVKRFKLSNMGI